MRQVHEATLIDLVYPTEIVGKRVRYRLDGSKLLKVRGALPGGSHLGLCQLQYFQVCDVGCEGRVNHGHVS